jgi:hypothetical protein
VRVTEVTIRSLRGELNCPRSLQYSSIPGSGVRRLPHAACIEDGHVVPHNRCRTRDAVSVLPSAVDTTARCLDGYIQEAGGYLDGRDADKTVDMPLTAITMRGCTYTRTILETCRLNRRRSVTARLRTCEAEFFGKKKRRRRDAC